MVATSHFMVSPVHKMTDPHSQDASASRQRRADETHVYTGAHHACSVTAVHSKSQGLQQTPPPLSK